MVFSSTLPPAALAQWSRTLRHGLDAGLSPVKVFRQQAKGGPAAGRAVAAVLADRLEKGDSLADALADHRDRFPLLFVELVTLGEKTGRLTDTCAELERYFDDVVSGRKKLVSDLTYPAVMYAGAVVTVALMVLVLGLLGGAFDPLGLGLLGPGGAMAVLAVGVLTAVAAVVGFLIVRENEGLRGKLEAVALAVPGVGACFRAFALHRFSTALFMTGEAGLRMDKGLRLAFRATANEAYLGRAESAVAAVKAGETVHEALEPGRGRLFPDEFLDSVQVGETTGRLPEVMHQQAGVYREESARKMKVLTGLLAGLVYLGVGLMVVGMIFRIAMGIGGVYTDAMKGL
jgi:type II secretory pathway component PulF